MGSAQNKRKVLLVPDKDADGLSGDSSDYRTAGPITRLTDFRVIDGSGICLAQDSRIVRSSSRPHLRACPIKGDQRTFRNRSGCYGADGRGERYSEGSRPGPRQPARQDRGESA
jgi:hypothetical protein